MPGPVLLSAPEPDQIFRTITRARVITGEAHPEGVLDASGARVWGKLWGTEFVPEVYREIFYGHPLRHFLPNACQCARRIGAVVRAVSCLVANVELLTGNAAWVRPPNGDAVLAAAHRAL